ncbi:hypothetical protein PCASD_21953 [Puccinia coronata f. sp. avenae]|uniref:Uncharacterized protein n=1 Tax=Puccinia coronata f. sp. avenae TaxID=200324 RepID=A0A2N5SKI4_9BASI|nr:hypothetical protein PCASD_21953 [Puccinia coronata f. sp. avenae]
MDQSGFEDRLRRMEQLMERHHERFRRLHPVEWRPREDRSDRLEPPSWCPDEDWLGRLERLTDGATRDLWVRRAVVDVQLDSSLWHGDSGPFTSQLFCPLFRQFLSYIVHDKARHPDLACDATAPVGKQCGFIPAFLYRVGAGAGWCFKAMMSDDTRWIS